jgi:hypothetical protein
VCCIMLPDIVICDPADWPRRAAHHPRWLTTIPRTGMLILMFEIINPNFSSLNDVLLRLR